MASENIPFNNVPSTIRKPGNYSEFNFSAAIRNLPANNPKIAILAQKTASGSATADKPIKILSQEDGVLYGGQGSIADLTISSLLKVNPNLSVDLVPIDDAGGSPSVGTITVANVPTSTGTLRIWIGNVLVEVTVTSGDAVNDIAAAIDTAIQAKEHLMPVTSGVSTAVVTLTARNDGLLGNNIAISYEAINILTTTFVVVQPVSGATDPSITNALAAIFPKKYDYILCTLNDATNLGLLKAHLVSVSSALEKRRGMGIYGWNQAQATVETLAGTTMNYERLSVGSVTYDKTTSQGHSLDYEIAGAYCAANASVNDPALPRNGVVLTGIAPPSIDNRYSRSEQESMLYNGVTPLDVNFNEEVNIVRAITNYTTSSAGYPDPARLDITTILSMDFGAFAIEFRQAETFQQAKKTKKSKDKVETQILDVMRQLEDLEIWHNIDEYGPQVMVEDDLQDFARVNTSIPTPVVLGLHVLGNKFNLVLG